ncbi:RHS repeat-associated protein [Dysgonomonas sp. PH5-45]|uniref:RHS repeat-associated core domain-containing protein n=1 Tax=unclassified Dysgonomonas TaxID=2630389 RepID=UPI002474FE19|nr:MULTISPECIES: RHS repeat-associated core domain-containing protein [unclassified Dysgonomonas]MDH6353687.1 RHS repeat-associated protein [Dysgonomonas sp. PH5-45]MDH6386590.1 RHS repeat-associated protein [Dysgonomonas sp. PH5-37]
MPNTSECAGHNQGIDVGYNAKYARSVESIRKNYAYFNEEYNGMDNNPYTGGHACLCENDLPASPMAASTNGLTVPKEERHQYFYHGDHLSSTTITTDANGDMAQSIQYTAFGEVFIEERYNNTWKTPFLFNVKELDDETGLYYYGARYYDPHTSLWLSVDPLAEKYPGVSPYAYCKNNPVNRIDPDGEDDYFVHPNGKIKQVEKDGEHTVVLVNKKGESTGMAHNIGDNVKLVNGKGKTQGLIINDQVKAHDAFKGIAEHTSVEYAKIEYNETATDTDKTLLYTNGIGNEVSATTMAKAIEYNGLGIVTTIDHSHPNGLAEPSGYDRISGEIIPYRPKGDAKSAIEYPTNAKGQPINRHVYVPNSKKAYKYDSTKFYPVKKY